MSVSPTHPYVSTTVCACPFVSTTVSSVHSCVPGCVYDGGFACTPLCPRVTKKQTLC